MTFTRNAFRRFWKNPAGRRNRQRRVETDRRHISRAPINFKHQVCTNNINVALLLPNKYSGVPRLVELVDLETAVLIPTRERVASDPTPETSSK